MTMSARIALFSLVFLLTFHSALSKRWKFGHGRSVSSHLVANGTTRADDRFRRVSFGVTEPKSTVKCKDWGHHPDIKEKRREQRQQRRQQAEAKAKRQEKRQQPDAMAKRKARRQQPEAIAKRKERRQARRQGRQGQSKASSKCRVGRRQDGFQKALCLGGAKTSSQWNKGTPVCPAPCRVELNGVEMHSSDSNLKLSTCSLVEDCKFGPFERILKDGQVVNAFYCVSMSDADTSECPDVYEVLNEVQIEDDPRDLITTVTSGEPPWPMPCSMMDTRVNGREVWSSECPINHTCSAIPRPVCVNGIPRRVRFCLPNDLPDEIDCDCEDTETVSGTGQGSDLDIVTP